MHSLWRLDVKSSKETEVFNPLSHGENSTLTAEEEKQRERLRETSSGITSYNLSDDGTKVCFTLSGTLWLIDAASLKAEAFNKVMAAFDPRFSPDGTYIAYATGEGLWIVATEASVAPKLLLENESVEHYWGRAEFAAAEEFERYRGFWWSPDSTKLVVSHVDESTVHTTYLQQADPWQAPEPYHYPAAGTPNADVSLFVCGIADKTQLEIRWDKQRYPYVTQVQWNTSGLYLNLQTRDQQSLGMYKVDVNGKTKKVHEVVHKPWVDVMQSLPYISDGGHIISLAYESKRRLTYDDEVITPSEHQVDDFIGLIDAWLVYTASPDSRERVVFATNIETKETKPLSPTGGIFSGTIWNNRLFVSGSTIDDLQPTRLLFDSVDSEPAQVSIKSFAAEPPAWPEPQFMTLGPDKLQTALLLPRNFNEKDKLPVLLQVYGGPHHQEVMLSKRSYLESQWWAEQGYAVLAIDGPGTPGRDVAWEQDIYGDFITDVANAQLVALKETFTKFAYLDTSRVAVRGWSFGGYLSAFLSCLYPEVFHASISGAPVTDWRLYDTHYTERYLGLPEENMAGYDTSSLLLAARKATRPILLIHGLGDDNVLFANSLQFLDVLSDARCPYQFIPLSGASHFTKQAEQRAWLFEMEAEFLRKSLQ